MRHITIEKIKLDNYLSIAYVKVIYIFPFNRCLHTTTGLIELEQATTCRVIMACAVLHNRAIRQGLPDPVYHQEGDQLVVDGIALGPQHHQDGVIARDYLVQHRFTR